MSPTEVRAAVSNGIPVPDLDLPVRESFNVDIQFDVALALSTRMGQRSSRLICSSLLSLRAIRM